MKVSDITGRRSADSYITAITEVWQKGHPTRLQVHRLLHNSLNGIADVELLSKSDTQGEVKVTFYVHTFLDTFGARGSSDRLLNYIFSIDKMQLNQGVFNLETVKYSRHGHEVFNRLFKKALMQFRSLVPRGWISNANTANIGLYSLKNEKITFYILRDFNQKTPHSGDYYHISYGVNKNSILKTGLIPRSNSRVGFHGFRDRIYLMTDHPSNDHDFVVQLITGGYFGDKDLDTEIAIFKVNVPEHISVYRDPEYNNGVYVEEPISSDHLSLLYSGTVRDFIK